MKLEILRYFSFVLLFLVSVCQTTYSQSIHLDAISNHEKNTAYLNANTEIIFFLRVNGDSNSHRGITNGFKVYSDDGANWTSTTLDTSGSLALKQFDFVFKINNLSISGSNADSVSVYGMNFNGTGLPVNFNDLAFSITIGPIPNESIGKTICIDTASTPNYPVWEWSVPEVIPAWGGPYCFEICEGADNDIDGIPYDCDNCPSVYNPEQEDWNNDGIGDSCVATDIGELLDFELPQNFALNQNYPNPFNPQTSIRYSLPFRSDVLIEIININGQTIRTLINEPVSAGTYEIEWDGNNSTGQKVSSGIYLYRFQTNDYLETKKMLLLK